MSKQPRGNVRVGAGNTAGARVSNIFTDVRKFHIRYQEAREKASCQNSQETDLQRAARMSAIQAIRSISNWMYWQAPNSGGSTANPHQYLTKTTRKSTEPNIGKLRDAVAARKKTINRPPTKNYLYRDDYWIPLAHALPAASTGTSSYPRTVPEASPVKEFKQTNDKDKAFTERNKRNSTSLVIPPGMGIVAALIARVHGEGTIGRLEEHVGGSFALQIVNSSWLPVILTGITWYIIGILAVGFIEAIKSRES